jgi:hypothetical protein
MIRISPAALACATLLAAISIAHAGTIDFSGLADGTFINNQYPGVVFSLQGGPDSSGSPMTFNWNGEAVANSNNSAYPTANILDMAFTSPVSGVSFTFDNDGSSNTATYYTAFDALHNVIDSANISAMQVFGLVTVTGSGIQDLQINNGVGPTENWYFSVQKLTFSPSSSVPEPASLTLFGSALIGLVAVRRRMRKAA